MFCRQCGFKLSDTANVCPSCGTKIRTVSQAQEERKEEPLVIEEEPKEEPLVIEEEPKEEPLVIEEEPKEEPLVIEEEPKEEPLVIEEEPEEEPLVIEEEIKEQPEKEPEVVKEEVKEEPKKEQAAVKEEVKEEPKKEQAAVKEEVKEEPKKEPVAVKKEKSPALQEFDWTKYKGILFAGAGILVVIVIVVVAISLLKGGKGQGVAENQTVVEEESSVSTQQQEEQAEESKNSALYAMLSNEEYENVISEIMNMNLDELSDEDAYMINAMLKEAIDGQLTNAFEEMDALAAEGNYDGVFEALEQEKSFRDGLALKTTIDNETLKAKEEQLKESYAEYVAEQANNRAALADEEGVDAIFEEADNRISGETYEQSKKKAYTTLILVKLSQMYDAAQQTFADGYNAEAALSYIEEHQEKSGNNCLVLENWDFFYVLYRIENGVANWEITVNHVSDNGYILEDSDSRELTLQDISELTRHELYLARMEIYARHGRCFMDSTVQQYFSQYGWYIPEIESNNFDEFSLSEVEIKNRDFILQYEEQQGYRNCR